MSPLVALSIIIVAFFATVLVVTVITRKTFSRALIDIIRPETLFKRSWSTGVVALVLLVVAVLVILVFFPE